MNVRTLPLDAVPNISKYVGNLEVKNIKFDHAIKHAEYSLCDLNKAAYDSFGIPGRSKDISEQTQTFSSGNWGLTETNIYKKLKDLRKLIIREEEFRLIGDDNITRRYTTMNHYDAKGNVHTSVKVKTSKKSKS